MRPRPRPRKTFGAAAPAASQAPRFNEAAAEAAENGPDPGHPMAELLALQ